MGEETKRAVGWARPGSSVAAGESVCGRAVAVIETKFDHVANRRDYQCVYLSCRDAAATPPRGPEEPEWPRGSPQLLQKKFDHDEIVNVDVTST